MKIDDAGLKPDRKNANKGTQRGRGLLEKSLRKLGAGRSILADKDGNIIAGNKTLEGAAEINLPVRVIETDGRELVVVKRTDLDLYSDTDKRARELAYADNKIAELDLDWNAELIAADFEPLDLDGWGFDDPTPAGNGDAEPQIDRAAELNEKWQVKTGDLWRIGEHRLLCGDSTKREDVERVMAGEKASICFTSPPYNAGVSAQLRGNTHLGDNLYKDEYDDNQSREEYLQLLTSFTDSALSICEYVFVNIQILAGNKRAFIDYWYQYADKFCDVGIWDKGRAAPQQALRVMNSRFEFVLIFGGNGSRAIGTKQFRGMVHNVFELGPHRNNENADIHGATFPLELPTHFIDTFTNLGEFIYEPFTGTGTTLVACENLQRKCRAIEISPNYCAVILERMSTAFPGIEISRIEA